MPITCQESTIIEYDRNSQKAIAKNENKVTIDGEYEKKYCEALCFKEKCKGWALIGAAICAIKLVLFPSKKAIAQ